MSVLLSDRERRGFGGRTLLLTARIAIGKRDQNRALMALTSRDGVNVAYGSEGASCGVIEFYNP